MAEHIAKTTDVDRMLSEMSHEQFDEWCAKDMVEPIGSMQTVCDILSKIGGIISAFMGHEMKEEHFMPWKKQAKRGRQLNPRQSAVAIRAYLQTLAGQ
jgi:hypothetical protein